MTTRNIPQAIEPDTSELGATIVADCSQMQLTTTVADAAIDRSCGVVVDSNLKAAILKLATYCEAHNWSGYDPYDALNSRLLQYLPFLDFRLSRIAATQLLRRCPFNLRRLLLIPPTQNAKAIALFLSAYLKLETIGLSKQQDFPGLMMERLIALRSTDLRYWSWGYSFPWQGRMILVPARAPNLVCTSFVANSLLDAYEQRRDARCLEMAVSAAEYILNELYWADGNSAAGFSYPTPGLRGETHNANLLAAALLCRVYKQTAETKFLDPALRAASYAATKQQPDGSWYYGEAPSQRWIDNFHTGYNLCALQSIGRTLGITDFESCIHRGLDFYLTHFFRNDGAARYFHDRTYPIDIHSVAQGIITLAAFKDRDPHNVPLANRVFRWAMEQMWDERGFFYYRVLPHITIRTSYMRWSQAWMLLALSTLVCESEGSEECRPRPFAADLMPDFAHD